MEASPGKETDSRTRRLASSHFLARKGTQMFFKIASNMDNQDMINTEAMISGNSSRATLVAMANLKMDIEANILKMTMNPVQEVKLMMRVSKRAQIASSNKHYHQATKITRPGSPSAMISRSKM